MVSAVLKTSMRSRHIARCISLLAAASLAAFCGAQVMRDPGTLPNGRHIPVPDNQQEPGLSPHAHHAGTPANAPAASVPAPATAPTPPAELPPSLLDQPAKPAQVSLAGGQLSVSANNSSLTDILHQLASTSGMAIDGLDKDSRVFGSYGPGNPRDILSSLLDGAGYNVMMIGLTQDGTPRQLLLSIRSNAPVVPQRSSPPPAEDDQEDNTPLNSNPPAGEPPPAETRPSFPQQNPGAPKTPQQILQELQQMRSQNQQNQQSPQDQNPQ